MQARPQILVSSIAESIAGLQVQGKLDPRIDNDFEFRQDLVIHKYKRD